MVTKTCHCFCELELSGRDWHCVMAQFYCGQLILVLCSIQYCFLVVKPFDLILEVLGSTLVLVQWRLAFINAVTSKFYTVNPCLLLLL